MYLTQIGLNNAFTAASHDDGAATVCNLQGLQRVSHPQGYHRYIQSIGPVNYMLHIHISIIMRTIMPLQCTNADLPPFWPSFSSRSSTQRTASRKITMLKYTGNERSIVNSAPPRMGAIIPPLLNERERHSVLCDIEKQDELMHTCVRVLKQFRTRYPALFGGIRWRRGPFYYRMLTWRSKNLRRPPE